MNKNSYVPVWATKKKNNKKKTLSAEKCQLYSLTSEQI